MEPKVLSHDESAHKYALLCDAIARILWADEYGIESYELLLGDQFTHTSDACRLGARGAMRALEEGGYITDQFDLDEWYSKVRDRMGPLLDKLAE